MRDGSEGTCKDRNRWRARKHDKASESRWDKVLEQLLAFLRVLRLNASWVWLCLAQLESKPFPDPVVLKEPAFRSVDSLSLWTSTSYIPRNSGPF